MSGRSGLSDEEIRALLKKRAGRPDIAGRLAAARSAAAATPQRRGGRFAWGTGPRPTLAGAAGLAALVLVLVAVGLASRMPSSGTPTGSPLAASGSPGPNLSPLPSQASGPIVLTVDELNGLIATNPGALSGRILIIDGVIGGTDGICTTGLLGGHCTAAKAYLERSNPELDVVPLPALGPGPWIGAFTAPPLSGPFASTLVNGTELDYLGPVTMTPALGAVSPSQLSTPSFGGPVATGYWLVHGWISGLAVVPSCPSSPPTAAPSGPQYTCGGAAALLSDDARQPVTITSGGFAVDGGAGSVLVQNGAYQEFAPAPESSGLQTRPEEATFLLQKTYVGSCPTGSSPCEIVPSDFHWAIVARTDPLPAVVAPPPPSPTPSAAPQPIRPLLADQVDVIYGTVSPPPGGLQLVINGTIGYQTPVGSCSGPISVCKRPPVLLGSYKPVFDVYPGPGAKLPTRLPFRGTFAATLGQDGILSYQGVVTTAPDGSPITPSELPARITSANPDMFWLVQGWIAGLEAALPCPIIPGSPQTGPQYGCGSTASLSDTDSQPVSDLQLTIPGDGVQVQNDAYNDFAPDPQSIGYQSRPERATFLVNVVAVNSCPGTDFCPVNQVQYHWAIVARIDPWPAATQP